jgi:DNA topoisomerase IA
MKVAEELYSKGLLSYPRTETEKFGPDADVAGLVALQRAHPQWGPYAARLADEPDRLQRPRAGAGDDQAHPPIHPVALARPEALDGDERRVYELVTRHFLAACSLDAVGERTQVRGTWMTAAPFAEPGRLDGTLSPFILNCFFGGFQGALTSPPHSGSLTTCSLLPPDPSLPVHLH